MVSEQKEKAVCLVSGGMDSAVTLAIALGKYDVCAMHVCYGQRTQDREIESFRRIVEHYKIERTLVISMEYISQIGASALTDRSIAVPQVEAKKGVIPITYVPFRNAQLLSAGVSWAEAIGAPRVFIGVVEEDSSGYPDCRETFINSFNDMISEGTKPQTQIEVVTPLIHMRKSEIVKKGIELGVPFELTWSCYKNVDRACGVCESCGIRLRAFKEAGVDDPLEYE